MIVTKKTSNDNIHWAVVTLNVAYVGLPFCLILSGLFYHFGLSKVSEKGASAYTIPILLSSLSAILKLFGFVFATKAFDYEEATKVTDIKTNGSFFLL